MKPKAYFTLFTYKLTVNQSNILKYCKPAQVHSSCVDVLDLPELLEF